MIYLFFLIALFFGIAAICGIFGRLVEWVEKRCGSKITGTIGFVAFAAMCFLGFAMLLKGT